MKHEFVNNVSGEKFTFKRVQRDKVELEAQVGHHAVYLEPLVVFENKDGVEIILNPEAPWLQDEPIKHGK